MPVTIPETVTFEQAIALTQSLFSQMEAGELSEAEIEAAITALVKSTTGARGFFVTYLTGDGPLADNPSPTVVQALQSAPDTVAELLVKNLAMSAAMAITHRRSQNEVMAQGSDRVRKRTAQIIQLVQLPAVYEQFQRLQESITTGQGSYQAFLDRWGYDEEQRQVIWQVLQQVV